MSRATAGATPVAPIIFNMNAIFTHQVANLRTPQVDTTRNRLSKLRSRNFQLRAIISYLWHLVHFWVKYIRSNFYSCSVFARQLNNYMMRYRGEIARKRFASHARSVVKLAEYSIVGAGRGVTGPMMSRCGDATRKPAAQTVCEPDHKALKY